MQAARTLVATLRRHAKLGLLRSPISMIGRLLADTEAAARAGTFINVFQVGARQSHANVDSLFAKADNLEQLVAEMASAPKRGFIGCDGSSSSCARRRLPPRPRGQDRSG